MFRLLVIAAVFVKLVIAAGKQISNFKGEELAKNILCNRIR